MGSALRARSLGFSCAACVAATPPHPQLHLVAELPPLCAPLLPAPATTHPPSPPCAPPVPLSLLTQLRLVVELGRAVHRVEAALAAHRPRGRAAAVGRVRHRGHHLVHVLPGRHPLLRDVPEPDLWEGGCGCGCGCGWGVGGVGRQGGEGVEAESGGCRRLYFLGSAGGCFGRGCSQGAGVFWEAGRPAGSTDPPSGEGAEAPWGMDPADAAAGAPFRRWSPRGTSCRRRGGSRWRSQSRCAWGRGAQGGGGRGGRGGREAGRQAGRQGFEMVRDG